jgi:hypothetical protein
MLFDLFIHIRLCFLRLVILMFRYKYLLLALTAVELIIIDISVLIYLISGGEMELNVIFIYYLVFRV